MKKNKVSKCSNCAYITNEINKLCPLCGHITITVEQEKRTYNQMLPQHIKSDKSCGLVYYCSDCDKVETNRICFKTNKLNKLAIIYLGQLVLLEDIKHLQEAFTDQEIADFLTCISLDEKDLIYLNYKASYRYFYRRDKTKAAIMFVMALMMAYLAFMLADYYQEDKTIIVSYFALGFALACFSIFSILGYEYLVRAASIEYEKKASKLVIFVSGIAFVYSLVMLMLDPGFILALRYLLFTLPLIFIVYLFYNIFGVKK